MQNFPHHFTVLQENSAICIPEFEVLIYTHLQNIGSLADVLIGHAFNISGKHCSECTCNCIQKFDTIRNDMITKLNKLMPELVYIFNRKYHVSRIFFNLAQTY